MQQTQRQISGQGIPPKGWPSVPQARSPNKAEPLGFQAFLTQRLGGNDEKEVKGGNGEGKYRNDYPRRKDIAPGDYFEGLEVVPPPIENVDAEDFKRYIAKAATHPAENANRYADGSQDFESHSKAGSYTSGGSTAIDTSRRGSESSGKENIRRKPVSRLRNELNFPYRNGGKDQFGFDTIHPLLPSEQTAEEALDEHIGTIALTGSSVSISGTDEAEPRRLGPVSRMLIRWLIRQPKGEFYDPTNLTRMTQYPGVPQPHYAPSRPETPHSTTDYDWRYIFLLASTAYRAFPSIESLIISNVQTALRMVPKIGHDGHPWPPDEFFRRVQDALHRELKDTLAQLKLETAIAGLHSGVTKQVSVILEELRQLPAILEYLKLREAILIRHKKDFFEADWSKDGELNSIIWFMTSLEAPQEVSLKALEGFGNSETVLALLSRYGFAGFSGNTEIYERYHSERQAAIRAENWSRVLSITDRFFTSDFYPGFQCLQKWLVVQAYALAVTKRWGKAVEILRILDRYSLPPGPNCDEYLGILYLTEAVVSYFHLWDYEAAEKNCKKALRCLELNEYNSIIYPSEVYILLARCAERREDFGEADENWASAQPTYEQGVQRLYGRWLNALRVYGLSLNRGMLVGQSTQSLAQPQIARAIGASLNNPDLVSALFADDLSWISNLPNSQLSLKSAPTHISNPILFYAVNNRSDILSLLASQVGSPLYNLIVEIWGEVAFCQSVFHGAGDSVRFFTWISGGRLNINKPYGFTGKVVRHTARSAHTHLLDDTHFLLHVFMGHNGTRPYTQKHDAKWDMPVVRLQRFLDSLEDADVNAQDGSGNTPIYYATETLQTEYNAHSTPGYKPNRLLIAYYCVAWLLRTRDGEHKTASAIMERAIGTRRRLMKKVWAVISTSERYHMGGVELEIDRVRDLSDGSEQDIYHVPYGKELVREQSSSSSRVSLARFSLQGSRERERETAYTETEQGAASSSSRSRGASGQRDDMAYRYF
ncbi:hypothetical protein ABW19_dt0209775 [Dactylella cylindrospora]|nr:hypothetical protein ABW19_dt0209775 [Dactylella cylindrospora]